MAHNDAATVAAAPKPLTTTPSICIGARQPVGLVEVGTGEEGRPWASHLGGGGRRRRRRKSRCYWRRSRRDRRRRWCYWRRCSCDRRRRRRDGRRSRRDRRGGGTVAVADGVGEEDGGPVLGLVRQQLGVRPETGVDDGVGVVVEEARSDAGHVCGTRERRTRHC